MFTENKRQSMKIGNGYCSCKTDGACMRYQLVINHGEYGTTYSAVDSSQPDSEQPCVVFAWSTVDYPNARYLAVDFCNRHNAKDK